jgi:putative ABC transport system permease protein
VNVSEGFRETFDMVRHNKLRTFLTMLGMNIGVAAVIAVLAIGLMGRGAVMEGVESIGATLMWIRPNRAAYPEGRGTTYLKPEDLTAIERIASGTIVSPILRGEYQLAYRAYQTGAAVAGVRPGYPEVWDLSLARGRFLSERDVRERSKVIVLGSNVARMLFGPQEEDPLGKQVRVGNASFTVIGVLRQRGRGAISDGTDDDTSFVPYETLEGMYDFSRYGGPRVFQVYLKVNDVSRLDEVSSVIERYFDVRYGRIDGEPRFTVRRAEDSISTFNSIFGVITSVITVIAAISLVVSGIGIMNIMLVAVSERTREIGIRKAVGAKRMDILVQFLIEAILICLIGGGIGVILGVLISLLVSAAQGWAYVMPVLGMILGIGVSFGIGLFFGIYPAMKAASLDPVVALTKE